MARVSILMNCFNGAEYVEQALSSIFNQTFKDFEVVFVDNNSTDKSAEIAKSFGVKVKIYKTPYKMTLCEGRVFARQFISGDFFCVLDVDDLWLPDKLKQQIDLMDAHPEVGLVYSNTVYFTDQGSEVLAYDQLMPSGRIFSELLSNYFISLETVMVRQSVMKKHNLYFSKNYNVSSDMEFFVKLSYYTDFLYCDRPLAKWRHGHANESSHQFKSFPREYRQLILDLKEMIVDFEDKYRTSIRSLNGVIENMEGMSPLE